jgi:hypothetical protein
MYPYFPWWEQKPGSTHLHDRRNTAKMEGGQCATLCRNCTFSILDPACPTGATISNDFHLLFPCWLICLVTVPATHTLVR